MCKLYRPTQPSQVSSVLRLPIHLAQVCRQGREQPSMFNRWAGVRHMDVPEGGCSRLQLVPLLCCRCVDSADYGASAAGLSAACCGRSIASVRLHAAAALRPACEAHRQPDIEPTNWCAGDNNDNRQASDILQYALQPAPGATVLPPSARVHPATYVTDGAASGHDVTVMCWRSQANTMRRVHSPPMPC